MTQKSYSFDKETLQKIGKGLLISMTGAAAIAGLEYIGALQIDNPVLAMVVASGVPFAVNAVKEFIKGY